MHTLTIDVSTILQYYRQARGQTGRLDVCDDVDGGSIFPFTFCRIVNGRLFCDHGFGIFTTPPPEKLW